MKEIKNPAEIIVDLLEVKARSARPFSVSDIDTGLYSRVHFEYEYAVISSAVSMLCNKYNVRSGDIEDEIRRREIASLTH